VLFDKTVGLRLNGNILTLSHDITTRDIKYDGKAKLRSLGLIADWHPFRGGFYVSGGVYWNGNKAELDATPSSSVSIGGTTYTPAQIGKLHGTAKANRIAPFLGIGYALSLSDTVSLGAEAGALYTGAYDVKLSSTNSMVSRQDLQDEEKKVEDKLDRFKVYPVLAIRATVHF
jgi:hypothetical protein